MTSQGAVCPACTVPAVEADLFYFGPPSLTIVSPEQVFWDFVETGQKVGGIPSAL